MTTPLMTFDEFFNQAELLNAVNSNDPDKVVRLSTQPMSVGALSSALAVAADRGHSQCVCVLIALCGPRDGHLDCVDLLYPVSDPEEALEKLQDDGVASVVWADLQERIQSEQQKMVLHDALDTEQTSINPKRKM